MLLKRPNPFYYIPNANGRKVNIMAKYIVTYEETLARTYIVEASSAREAENIAYDAVKRGRIVLDGDDYVSGEITRVEESCGQDEWWFEEI